MSGHHTLLNTYFAFINFLFDPDLPSCPHQRSLTRTDPIGKQIQRIWFSRVYLPNSQKSSDGRFCFCSSHSSEHSKQKALLWPSCRNCPVDQRTCRDVSAHCLSCRWPMPSPCVTCSGICILTCPFNLTSVYALPSINLLVCSSPPKDFCYLASCTMLSPSHFGWSICLLFSIIWCLSPNACSSPSFMTWKSLNFNRNHVPAYPVSSSSSPVILKYISYLVILTLCPGIRCAHPVDFESSCQATLSLGSITISLQLIANIWCRVKCLQRAYM